MTRRFGHASVIQQAIWGRRLKADAERDAPPKSRPADERETAARDERHDTHQPKETR